MIETILKESSFLNTPQSVLNMHKSGVQLISKCGKFVAKKVAKGVRIPTPWERGENVKVIACCSAEGQFLPSILILNGVSKKQEFCDGLPNGSEVYMNPKSSRINSVICLKWFREHFLQESRHGNVSYSLTLHASHCNAFELVELADSHDITILCLLTHTTQVLQPLQAP
jgi:hypothetical protein